MAITKVLLRSTRYAAIFLLAIAFMGAGCLSLPVATLRPATIVATGESRVEAGLSLATSNAHGEHVRGPCIDICGDSEFGGPFFEANYRKGVTEGVDEAFRVGISAFGFAAGYERGWALLKPGGQSSLIGFGGILAGAQLGHFSGQPYLGFVYGRSIGIVRPEVALKFVSQAGFLDKQRYLVGASTLEPRLRLRVLNADAILGVGGTLGYGACDPCFFLLHDGPKSFDALHIVAGIALGLD